VDDPMAKNIILLSDGTGNAASSFWRTNVWRIFQSIDLTGSDQVACYDDGVGTSSFKPLAILGGAFGWGLKRNVIHLYKFLCRNYEPDCKIYAFGFSRGSFTIRVLIGLVVSQGLIPFTTEADLDGKAIAAYLEFRRARYGTKAGALFRPLRNLWVAIQNVILRRERYNAGTNRKVESIRFLGLWDTVAAYGLPVDEWTIGIDRFIWPLELPDRKLWMGVERACHALALDDERTTFHPVLWDEKNQPEGKIAQVWFCGMHSNVGGGYPDDSLAGVPLLWIMQQADAAGLRFKVSPQQPDTLLVAKSSHDKDGRLYDSRSGLASYYRYGPRDVETLCVDVQNDVTVNIPKIHESVFARMKSNTTAYAPIGLPKVYAIAKEDGTVVPQGSAGFETTNQAETRYQLQQRVWNAVWWKRVVYFLTVAATLNLVLFPLFYQTAPAAEFETRFRIVPEAIRTVGKFLPSFVTDWWLDSFATNTNKLLLSISAVVILTFLGMRLATTIEDRMLAAWKRQVSTGRLFAEDAIQRLRTSKLYKLLISSLKYNVAPFLFASLTIVVVSLFVLHLSFYLEDAAGFTCTASPSIKSLKPNESSGELTFNANNMCWATGIQLQENFRYVIKITHPQDWKAGDYAADLGGYGISSLPTIFDRIKMTAAVPLRRVLLRPWFRIIARVGVVGTDEYFLDPDATALHPQELEVPFYAHRDGELYLYVNDAVLPFWHLMDAFYLNNGGTATVTVTQKGPPAH
jgi:uncharacterized protein (DUF2235 family)